MCRCACRRAPGRGPMQPARPRRPFAALRTFQGFGRAPCGNYRHTRDKIRRPNVTIQTPNVCIRLDQNSRPDCGLGASQHVCGFGSRSAGIGHRHSVRVILTARIHNESPKICARSCRGAGNATAGAHSPHRPSVRRSVCRSSCPAAARRPAFPPNSRDVPTRLSPREARATARQGTDSD